EGMPDMSKLMKIMIYISPVMMMFFCNNYASGLSLYYFTSNLITIGIMYVIKCRIINEDKVKAQIEENKTKERPKNKFQRKMEEMMEQAQQQKKKYFIILKKQLENLIFSGCFIFMNGTN